MHFDYQVPFNKDLDIPYRTNRTIISKIDYIFKHPSIRKFISTLYIDVSTSFSRQCTSDMANVAVAMTKHFVDNPQQYAHSMENIELQILVRMWKQVIGHTRLQDKKDLLTKYEPMDMKALSIDNGLFDELLRTVKEEDYITTNDSMVKVRKGVGLRERREMRYKENQIKYYEQFT